MSELSDLEDEGFGQELSRDLRFASHSRQCVAQTERGKRCKRIGMIVVAEHAYCHVHAPIPEDAESA